MLASNYRYVALDFETTGLDVQRDEPIQVGIVELDCKANYVSSFVSYIKPKADVEKLRQQVSLITGLHIEDVQDAPHRSEVQESIAEYIDERTFLIGHNISFDRAILRRYCPHLRIAGLLDTYDLARHTVHFASSYSLEAIFRRIRGHDSVRVAIQQRKKSITHAHSDWNHQAHDALFDSIQAQAVWWYAQRRIHALGKEHPTLFSILGRSNSAYARLYQPSISDEILSDLPLLQRPFTTAHPHKEDSSTWKSHKGLQVYAVDDISLSSLLHATLGKKVLLAFSHGSKLDRVKELYKKLGHNNIGFLREDQAIHPPYVKLWLQQDTYTESERFFVLKYLSQYKQGMSVLDLKSLEDKKIYESWRKQTRYVPHQTVLATHGGLYALLENNLTIDTDRLDDYHIVFADHDRRYTSYNNYANKPFDPHRVQEYTSILAYKYTTYARTRGGMSHKTLADGLTRLASACTMFIPLWCKEIREHIGSASTAECNPMLDHINFYRSSLLWHRIMRAYKKVFPLLSDQEQHYIRALYRKQHAMLTNVVRVRSASWGQYNYYTCALETQYIDYTEFADLFQRHQAWGLSTTDTTRPCLDRDGWMYSHTDRKGSSRIQEDSIATIMKNIAEIYTNNPQACIFILSAKKHHSQRLVDALHAKRRHQKISLIAHNITGGVGKCVAQTKQSGFRVCIGSYHLLLRIFANNIHIDIGFAFHIDGVLKETILADIEWYGEKLVQKNSTDTDM